MKSFLARQYLGLFTASALVATSEFAICIVASVVSGRCLGVDAFAALAAVYAYRLAPDVVAMLLADGVAVLYAQSLGRCDRENAARVFTLGLVTAAAVGCLLTGAFLAFEGNYLDFVGVTGAVRNEAYAFGRGFVWSILLTVVLIYLTGIIYVDGGSRLCLLKSVIYVIVHSVTAWIFCQLWGTEGLAWSIMFSYLLSSSVLFFHFRSRSCTLRLRMPRSVRPLVAIVALGIGTAIQPISAVVMGCILSRYASLHFGRTGLAVLSAVAAAEALLYFSKAAGRAAQPLVSVYHGEGNPLGVRRTMRLSLACILAETLVLSLVLTLCPHFVIWLFGLEDLKLLCAPVRIVGTFLFPASVAFFWGMYFRMVGSKRLLLVFSLFQWLLFPLAAIFAGVSVFGVSGLACGFLGQAVWLAASSVVLGIYARRRGLSFPLFLSGRAQRAWTDVSVVAGAAGAAAAASAVRKALSGKIPAPDTRAVMMPLAAEEMVNVIAEANPGRTVRVEIAIDLTNLSRVRLVIRDDGVLFDLTDPDRRVTSLASYMIARIVAHSREYVSLTTSGHNRSVLEFDRGASGFRSQSSQSNPKT